MAEQAGRSARRSEACFGQIYAVNSMERRTAFSRDDGTDTTRTVRPRSFLPDPATTEGMPVNGLVVSAAGIDIRCGAAAAVEACRVVGLSSDRERRR